MKKLTVVGLILVAAVSCAIALAADYYRSSPDEIEARYVGRASCVQCHQSQMTAFEGSDHDLAMDLATDSTVLANFDNQSIEHYGITSRMFRDGKKFMVHTDGPDGQMRDYEVKYVFGVRPLQQYMVELERPANAKANEIGRVQVLRMSWDTEKKSWFYLMPPDVDEAIEPSDPLHWTGITQNWNASCASCHSTDVHKNFTASIGEYHTTFSEIDVSCEACHGPASYHLELANRKSLFWDRNHGYGLAKLKGESNVAQVTACAPCHSRRSMMSETFQPGCNFDDYFATQLITSPIYHVDGQVRDEDYVYGSFIQSKMYHKGVKCTDCHDPHSAKVKFKDNTLCTSCHQNQHPAGKYDTPNHHHHAPGTPGSYCVDCHMPTTTYMMLDHRRDHSFRVPRPDLSLKFGTPNACTQCHLDESKVASRTTELPLHQYLDWIAAAEQGDEVVATELKRINETMQRAITDWYPEKPEIERTKYYEDLALGLSEKETSNDALMRLAVDAGVPAFIRASALAGLSPDDSEASFATATKALNDDDPKVVAAALLRIDAEIGRISGRIQYEQASQGDIAQAFEPVAKVLAPLFSHPSKRVRTEAARVFVTLGPATRNQFTTPRERSDFNKAVEELELALLVENDRAASHMMLGGLQEMLGDMEKAKRAYRAAISAEKNVAGPRTNLAAVLDGEVNQLRNQMRAMQQGQGGVQAGQLKDVLTQIQTKQVQIAQLRAEEHLLLENDIRRSEGLPDTHSLHYRFAMSAFLQRDIETAEKHLKLAFQQRPEEEAYQLGLATFYVQFNQPTEAMVYIDMLLKQSPNHQGYLNLKRSALQLRPTPPSNDQQPPTQSENEQ